MSNYLLFFYVVEAHLAVTRWAQWNTRAPCYWRFPGKMFGSPVNWQFASYAWRNIFMFDVNQFLGAFKLYRPKSNMSLRVGLFTINRHWSMHIYNIFNCFLFVTQFAACCISKTDMIISNLFAASSSERRWHLRSNPWTFSTDSWLCFGLLTLCLFYHDHHDHHHLIRSTLSSCHYLF